MRPENLGTLLAAIASAIGANAMAGEAFAEDRNQLAQRLESGAQCCVVDARGDIAPLKGAIPFALAVGAQTRVKAGAFALVVADSDSAALKAAREIARRSAGDAIAVEGGYATWAALTGAAMPGADAPTLARRFTVPSNTCEQGPALQEYRR